MNSAVRCFVALTLPEAVRESIAGFFAREGRAIAAVRWTEAPRLHLTLQFLGDVAADWLPAVRAAIDAAAAGHGPFRLEVRGAGAFPSAQRPRIVWVGVGAGAVEVSGLAASLTAALAPLGFAPEARPFTPHLTVGRLREPPRDREAIPRLLAAAADRIWGETLIPAVHLMRSELFPAGPIYSILAASPLSGVVRQGR
jgi:2'-5' RNA ligase